MSPRAAPKKTKPIPPWRRETAGTYRSSDDRFVVEGDGAGRWFVRDEAERDELGLPRTTGPHATLADAKRAADEQRSRGPEASPLAGRLAEGEKRRRPERTGRRDSRSGPTRGDDRTSAGRATASHTERGPARAPAPPAPEPTWLDILGGKDAAAASRARAAISDLERLGLEDADATVRRDVLTDAPAIATRLLAEGLRRRLRAELTPDRLIEAARAAKVDVDDPHAFGSFAVARVVEVVLDEVSGRDRLEGAPARLPGWQLNERGGARRALRIAAEDLAD